MYIETNRTSQVFNDLHEEGISSKIDNNIVILYNDTKLQAFISFLADYNQDTVNIDFDFMLSKVTITFTS